MWCGLSKVEEIEESYPNLIQREAAAIDKMDTIDTQDSSPSTSSGSNFVDLSSIY